MDCCDNIGCFLVDRIDYINRRSIDTCASSVCIGFNHIADDTGKTKDKVVNVLILTSQ